MNSKGLDMVPPGAYEPDGALQAHGEPLATSNRFKFLQVWQLPLYSPVDYKELFAAHAKASSGLEWLHDADP